VRVIVLQCMLQCVAAGCSVLQCAAMSCIVLQCFVSVKPFIPMSMYVCCGMLQCIAVYCSVLQCVAMCCSVLHQCSLPS